MRLLIVLFAAGALPLTAMAQAPQITANDCVVAQGLDSGDARLESKCREEIEVAWCVRGGGGTAQRCPQGGGSEIMRTGKSVRVQWTGKGALEWGACVTPHRVIRDSKAGRFACRRN